jgi:hypothetical protein
MRVAITAGSRGIANIAPAACRNSHAHTGPNDSGRVLVHFLLYGCGDILNEGGVKMLAHEGQVRQHFCHEVRWKMLVCYG